MSAASLARPDMSGVSLTAHFTAYSWHKLGVPEAHRFVTRRGRLLHAATRPLARLSELAGVGDPEEILLVPRYHVLEAQLQASGCRTFVELGAGLSPRGTAYALEPGVTYLEVDLPGQSQLKERLVGDGRGAGLRFIAGDALDPELYPRLAAEVAGRGPVAALAEGLIAYLPRDGVKILLAGVCQLLRRSGGGILLFDLNPADAVERFGLLGRFYMRLIGWVARWPLDLPIRSVEDALSLLRNAGFDEVIAHDTRDHPAAAGLNTGLTRGALLIIEGRVDASAT